MNWPVWRRTSSGCAERSARRGPHHGPDPAAPGGRLPGGDGPARPGTRCRRGPELIMTLATGSLPHTRNLTVVDPATGEAFDEAPDLRPEELDAVVDRAREAWHGWRADPAARRAALLAAADAVDGAAAALAPAHP
ncbi:hypothetical protein SHKM778_33620 [Streptomyces sp. KM77-8]|uniref:Aldehyde dehydrogenase domain-containing protein n=1 Tax=Streptomyces haneummycinicus TaxID=3074435 RepID=A0AAT9HHT4_9ACTN